MPGLFGSFHAARRGLPKVRKIYAFRQINAKINDIAREQRGFARSILNRLDAAELQKEAESREYAKHQKLTKSRLTDTDGACVLGVTTCLMIALTN
jgi:hypothetical protein